MIASELISNVVPVLKPEDTCLQALNWMELFRVSHLPMEQGKMYLGLVDDEMIYAHGDLNDRLDVLQIPVEGTFVYENYHIYDVICLAAGSLLSVVPVLDRKNNFDRYPPAFGHFAMCRPAGRYSGARSQPDRLFIGRSCTDCRI